MAAQTVFAIVYYQIIYLWPPKCLLGLISGTNGVGLDSGISSKGSNNNLTSHLIRQKVYSVASPLEKNQ